MKKAFISVLLVSFAIFFTSCGSDTTSNLEIPGVQGPYVKLETQNILIDMVFDNILLEGSLDYNIPKLPNSFVKLYPEANGSLHLAFIANINDILQGYGQTVDPLKLPGGRPLPGVLSGSLPAMAFTIEKFKNVTFYIGTDVFGFFVPFDTGFDLNIITVRYYIEGKRGGNISLVGRDETGENSGMLLLLDLSAQVRTKLKEYVSVGHF